MLEKLEMEDIGLTADLKLTVTFSLFLSGVGARPVLRRLPFRSEYRNRNNCPDLFLAPSLHSATLDPISAWNIGVLLFQLLHNALPFPLADQDLLSQSKSCRFPAELAALLQREHKLVFPQLARHPQLGELVRSLLNPHPSARLKLSLVVLHPFLQQFPSPPHVPVTPPRSCPPPSSPVPLPRPTRKPTSAGSTASRPPSPLPPSPTSPKRATATLSSQTPAQPGSGPSERRRSCRSRSGR